MNESGIPIQLLLRALPPALPLPRAVEKLGQHINNDTPVQVLHDQL